MLQNPSKIVVGTLQSYQLAQKQFTGRVMRMRSDRLAHIIASALFLAWSIVAVHPILSQTDATKRSEPPTQLDKQFLNPQSISGPWVFWMWLRVQTNHAAITRDLEEMRAKGIEGAIIYDSGVGTEVQTSTRMVLGHKGYEQSKTDDFAGGYISPIPLPEMKSWEPDSDELLRYAAKEAGRLGIKLVVSIGLGGTSGSIPAEYGQQRLVWSEVNVEGPSKFNGKLPEPLKAVQSSQTSLKVMVASDPAPVPGKFNPSDIAVLAVPDKPGFTVADVVSLSANSDAAGVLRWEVPAGKWKILRFAYVPTGRTSPWGYCTDGMSAEALDVTWGATIGAVINQMSPQERKGLYGIEDDSWEAGQTSWTKLFASEFQRLRGYDLISWLPVLAGQEMGSETDREGVKRDYYRTIADLIATNHYAHLTKLAHRNGLISYSEAAGPNSAQLDPMQNSGYIDVPMAEFWAPSPHRPTLDSRFLARDAASGSHIYGRKVMGCESFTSVGPHWEESLFDLKNAADQAFGDGCNLNFIHAFSQTPSITAKPGYVYFAGTHYDRNVTWWDETPAFNAYLGRTALLLQQGVFVADALYYRGDAIGQIEQRKTVPALPAEGYDHDNANLDVLLHRVEVKNGRITLPDGMSYRILVLPDDAPMPLEALRKINSLVNVGAIVVGPPPRGMAGLVRSPAEQMEFDTLISSMWKSQAAGDEGSVFRGTPVEALRLLHTAQDFAYEGLSDDGEIDWIHRKSGNMDIYFIASRWDTKEKITSTFRVAGMQPEIWNPVTGQIRNATAFQQVNGRTVIPLEFDPSGSLFIVFRYPIPASTQGTTSSNFSNIVPLTELKGPWEVTFDPMWGGPKHVVFDDLIDWTQRLEDSIRYYSGTAVYRKTFNLTSSAAEHNVLLLNLGEIHEEAVVKLNGIDVGVVWTKPARIDVTRAARLGQNDLEISVTNLWPNRLIGDDALPPSKRLTRTNIHKFSATTPLYPSGLDGPVVLETATP